MGFARWQRTRWPGETSTISGICVSQWASFWVHRVQKLQPAGRLKSEGTMPSIVLSLLTFCPGFGSEASRPCVYGCPGELKIVLTSAIS